MFDDSWVSRTRGYNIERCSWTVIRARGSELSSKTRLSTVVPPAVEPLSRWDEPFHSVLAWQSVISYRVGLGMQFGS